MHIRFLENEIPIHLVFCKWLLFLHEYHKILFLLIQQKDKKLVKGLIKRSISPGEKAIKEARISKGDIGEVILVGGMTRILKVIDTVKTVLEKEPTRSVNPVKQLF